jgi:hypothetical protein
MVWSEYVGWNGSAAETTAALLLLSSRLSAQQPGYRKCGRFRVALPDMSLARHS